MDDHTVVPSFERSDRCRRYKLADLIYSGFDIAREILTSLCARCLRLGLNLAAVDERDRWIEDDLIPGFNTAVYLDPRAHIALHFAVAI